MITIQGKGKTVYGPNIVTDGLVLYLDAANIKSYVSGDTIWNDLSGNGNSSGILMTGITHMNNNMGGMLFNGASYIRPPISHSYLDSSACECVFKLSQLNGRTTIFGYRGNSGYSQPTIGTMYIDEITYKLKASVITTSQTYRTVISSTTIETGITYDVILNKDTINGFLHIYINGQLEGTMSFDAQTYALWPPASPVYVGENIMDIGKLNNDILGQGWGLDYINGYIYICKVYNRILTSSEILQNYNATKSRFK